MNLETIIDLSAEVRKVKCKGAITDGMASRARHLVLRAADLRDELADLMKDADDFLTDASVVWSKEERKNTFF